MIGRHQWRHDGVVRTFWEQVLKRWEEVNVSLLSWITFLRVSELRNNLTSSSELTNSVTRLNSVTSSVRRCLTQARAASRGSWLVASWSTVARSHRATTTSSPLLASGATNCTCSPRHRSPCHAQTPVTSVDVITLISSLLTAE